MKSKIILLTILFPFLSYSQQDEGVISYVETVKMDIDIPKEHREQLAGLIPESQITKKVLLFNSIESIYKDDEGQDVENVVEAGSESSGMKIKMVMARPDLQLYKNITENHVIEQEDIMGRKFRIIEDLPALPWKIANEEKKILGYTCHKAYLDINETHVEAWFAPQIPIANGPMAFGQLPGLILELDLDLDHGQVIIKASDILFKVLDKGAISKPEKGKKVSREKFEAIQEAKEKEMEEEFGGGGGRMIIRQRGE